MVSTVPSGVVTAMTGNSYAFNSVMANKTSPLLYYLSDAFAIFLLWSMAQGPISLWVYPQGIAAFFTHYLIWIAALTAGCQCSNMLRAAIIVGMREVSSLLICYNVFKSYILIQCHSVKPVGENHATFHSRCCSLLLNTYCTFNTGGGATRDTVFCLYL